MTLGMTYDQKEPIKPETIAKILFHELSAHDKSEYPAIEEEFAKMNPSLNIKKMINEFEHGNSSGIEFWCRCGIGKRYRHNGESEFIAGEGKTCTCTVLVHPVPN